MDLREMEAAHRARLLALMEQIPAGVPAGWEKETFAVGGLLYAGFSGVRPEKLVVISTQGQSVMDCRTGEKTYCPENYDEDELIALAEELGDEPVPIAGVGGGGLCRFSKDGSQLEAQAPFWPKERVIFLPEHASWSQKPEQCTVLWEDYELRAFGFSRCGNFMAVCDSASLHLFRKT